MTLIMFKMMLYGFLQYNINITKLKFVEKINIIMNLFISNKLSYYNVTYLHINIFTYTAI